ncbi:putative homeobox-leucine zipper protein HOX26 [Brachypodium distachyon]|uniref:Homeobox domain-containing protein n=1 Tax=Brachypodium distachyon TaxID=15368 RepID=I1HX94_BRADI|nr:putative homeobox-leucine zipper protein HOX26 [Brachypodium distachyon]KQJ93345.1 hypothetical protein BRADI_3g03970v3 [Brachypodium distachyon]PNT65887.1 hypothetical protein BRADI_3g03970v3 [Brachypodium distachyon]|eukprot:XP_003570938.2 putative homeobox-leucine zipper protein HOX26 [Brachypodium distachyon]
MSSVSTISSSGMAMAISMEDSPEDHQLVDTRLSLFSGAGLSRPPPPQALLLQAAPQPEHQASPAGRKKKAGSKQNKRAEEMGSGDGARRKKLRLTEEQAALLEESFRAHNVLSHGEKQDLARRLRLRARQVEVWFQNRRARTKLKQTELDCDLLRRLCDRLTHDNALLRRQLADLRSAGSGSSSGSSSSSSRLTWNSSDACPSCSKIAGAGLSL